MGFLSDLFRGWRGLEGGEHDRYVHEAEQRKSNAVYQAHRSAEEEAIRHRSFNPTRCPNGVVMVSDSSGNTHVVDKDTYDRYTSTTQRELMKVQEEARRREDRERFNRPNYEIDDL
jgi:hypothetical protein